MPPHYGLLLIHPRFSWVANCLLSLIPVFSPSCSYAPRLGSSLSSLRWTHSSSWLQPSLSQAGNVSSHLSSPLPISNPHCQTVTLNHPQPGPSSLFPSQGFQRSPPPQLHLWYFLSLYSQPHRLTLQESSVLRIHSHLTLNFQTKL